MTRLGSSRSRVRNTKDYCEECGDPLGATGPVCFDCGGTQDTGPRIGPEQWQILLGVGGAA